MNASDLVRRVAERTGASRKMVRAILDATLDEMSGELAAGRRVSLSGFGTFEVQRRPPRAARNPRTGAPIQVPERRVVVFRPGVGLRRVVETESEPDHAPPPPSASGPHGSSRP